MFTRGYFAMILVALVGVGFCVFEADAAIVAQWKLDDGTGNTAIDSVGASHGTLTGSVPWITGMIDGALLFDGVDDKVSCGNGLAIDQTGALTVMLWINKKAVSANSVHLAGKDQSDGADFDSYYVQSDPNDRIKFAVTASANIELMGATAVSRNDWHHIAAVFVPGTSMTIYVDGQLYATQTTGVPASTALSSTTPFTLGQISGSGAGSVFNGYMDDVRLYNTALTQTEIRVVLADSPFFTIVAIPDTQWYSNLYPDIFMGQTQWIANSVYSRKVAFVAHLGDMVDWYNRKSQWNNADAAMDILNNVVPYGAVMGNHDTDASADLGATWNKYFGAARFTGFPGYGAHSPDGLNSYHTFTAGGRTFLSIHLDLDAPDAALQWAQGILDAHPTLPAIVSTHVYLSSAGGRDTVPCRRSSNGNSGQQVWEKLIRSNNQIFMTLNGHWPGERMEVAYNDRNKAVYQILVDYQNDPMGGNGWLQMYTFKPSKNQIYVTTYSPYLNQSQIDGNSQYTINVNFDSRFDFNTPPAVAHWKLDDGVANPDSPVAIDSAGINNGILGGFDTPPLWTAGIIGGGLIFDGDDAVINAGTGTALNITGSLTMAMWINKQGANVNNDYGHLAGKKQVSGPVGDGYYLESTRTDTIVFGIRSVGVNTELTGTTPVTRNEWHHVAAVFLPSRSMTIYIDGNEYATQTLSVPATVTATASTPFTIGKMNGAASGWAFNGTLDDIRLYNVALTSNEILTLYQSDRPYCTAYKVGDVNRDCYVDLLDFTEIAAAWQECTDCMTYKAGDINKDCCVNLLDLADIAAIWLECTDVGNAACQ